MSGSKMNAARTYRKIHEKAMSVFDPIIEDLYQQGKQTEADNLYKKCNEDCEAYTQREWERDYFWYKKTETWWIEKEGNITPGKIKNWFFITISPSDRVSHQSLFALAKLLNQSTMSFIAQLVFEQRGECDETLGKQEHIHAIIKYKYNRSIKQIVSDIMRLAKKIKIEDDLAMNCVDVKRIPDMNNFTRCKTYINTKEFGKANDKKRPAWELNNRWRLLRNLPESIKSVSREDFVIEAECIL